MASVIWLIVWLVQGTPNLEWFGSWNDWSVALLGCIVFDVSAAVRRPAPAGHVVERGGGEEPPDCCRLTLADR